MRTASSFCLALVIATIPATTWAQGYPEVTWDSGPTIWLHVNNPIVARSGTWTCSEDNTGSHYPIDMRCIVADITAGGWPGTPLVTADCGTGLMTPTTVSYDYDVPGGVVHGTRYAYAAQCIDSDPAGVKSYTSWYHFWYDAVGPTVSIDSTPTNPSNANATFELTCDEDSLTWDFGGGFYVPECDLYCTLYDASDGSLASATRPCDTPSVTDASTVAAHAYSNLPTGSYRFEVFARDGAGNVSATVQHTWTVDADPPDTTIDTAPAAVSADTAPAFEFSCTEPPCTFECTLTNSGGTTLSSGLCTSGSTFALPADDIYTMIVLASDAVGNADTNPSGSTWTWEHDTTPPDTEILTGPPAATHVADASFTFQCDDAPCTFACAVTDGGGNTVVSGACNSGDTFTMASDGIYTLVVLATDEAGNSDVDPVGTTVSTWTWTLDRVAPDTQITGGPGERTTNPDAVVDFTCNEAACTFACTLTDGGGNVVSSGACTSGDTITVPTDGEYTLEVLATDAAGNSDTDPSGSTITWIVDRTAPDTTLTSSPPTATNLLDATFEFACDDSPLDSLPCIFACVVTDSDGTSLFDGACTSGQTFTVGSENSYTLEVTATDSLGNADASPASFTWIVDQTAPAAPVIDAPAADETLTQCPTLSGTAEPGATIIISLDGTEIARVTAANDGSWSFEATGNDCPDDGSHTLSVTAEDPAGNPSPPATVDFDFALDTDQDGLTDALEDASATDSADPDSDDDGLCDGPLAVLGTCVAGEDANANGVVDTGETDPMDADSDDGGVNDGEEITRGTDPLDDWDDHCVSTTDCDGDGISDADELTNGTDPKLSDTDSDGLSDSEELTAGTDGTVADTDGDGLADGVEVHGDNPTDPLDDDADDDGLLDGQEDTNGNGAVDAGESDPTVADTDGDGLDDGVELNGDNPTDPAAADSDGDGLDDGVEDANGNGNLDEGETDPNVADTDGDGLGDATDPEPLVPRVRGSVGVPRGCDCGAATHGLGGLLAAVGWLLARVRRRRAR